jgi:hypothetical protein
MLRIREVQLGKRYIGNTGDAQYLEVTVQQRQGSTSSIGRTEAKASLAAN